MHSTWTFFNNKLNGSTKRNGCLSLRHTSPWRATNSDNACIVHLEGLRVDFERRYNDLIKMDYQLWFVDLEHYEPGDENVELVVMFLDLKENVKQRRRVDKEGVFADISIKDSHPNIFRHGE